MQSVSEFLLNYLVNATWQIPVIAIVAAAGSLLLKNSAARYRHLLWLATLTLCVVVPLLTTVPVSTATHATAATEANPATHATSANQSRSDVSAVTPQAPLWRVAPEPDLPISLTKRRTQIVSTTSQTALWLTFAYALFIAWRGIRFIRFWRHKEKLRRSADLKALSGEAQKVAQRCRAIFGIKNVEVVQSSSARMPYTIGARRPLIVLPEAFCAAEEARLLSIVGHEMAHVARRDYVTNLICELALLPISFHPVAFLIKRQIDRARELACDELVSRELLPPKTYARSLVWAADVSNRPQPQALMLSMFDARSLEERIMRLTRTQKRLSRSMAQALTSIVLFALCASAVALSLFSFELKTEARAVFTPPSSLNSNTVAAEPATQHPRPKTTEPQQPVAEPQPPATETRLDTTNAQQHAEAACEIGRKRNTEQIPTLIAMLGDDTRTELIRCWDSGRWSPALETFKHPSPGEQAAIALASMGHVAFRPLANQLDSSDAVVRRNAAWAIGELTNMQPGERDDAAPQLIALLTDADSWVRMAAARALGELRSHTAVPGLVANLADADARVREVTVWALSELKDKRAVAALCNVLLTDQRPDVRRGAAEALGEIASREALPSLKQALNDPEVRARAQWAISEIEGE